MPSFIRANPSHRDSLIPLMRDFYAEEHLPLTPPVFAAIDELLAAETLGRLYLIHQTAPAPAGYFTLTFGYSLERGGRFALLDELYILPAHRRQGLAKAALAFATDIARENQCRSLHLEVARANAPACALYHHAGFIDPHRHYLTLPL